jgi:hypothetical protein
MSIHLIRQKEYEVVLNLLKELFSPLEYTKIFFLASPSWGKTTLIINLFESKVFKKIFYLSPLTALNLEFFEKLKVKNIPCYIFQQDGEVKLDLELLSNGILISTPEKIIFSQKLEVIQDWAEIIIVDEFHLFLLWEHFRPNLRECWMWLSHVDKNVLLLSGTFVWETWYKNLDAKLWLQNTDRCFKLDLHADQLLCSPAKEWIISSTWRSIFLMMIKIVLIYFTSMKILIFFPRRNQVLRWERWCRKYHVSFLSCLGGGALSFMEKLKQVQSPSVILSTSVLSHGVNLPSRNLVVVFGNSWTQEMWKQMKSRGGRSGEKYYFLSEKQLWMN